MNTSWSKKACAGSAFVPAFAWVMIWAACVQPALGQGAAGSGPKAEDVYKNIQVFKGQPAEEILITMRFIRASLGVACT